MCAAAGLAYTYLRPAVYVASASLHITPAAGPAGPAAQAGAQPAPQIVGVERYALTTQPLLLKLLARLSPIAEQSPGLPRTVADLQQMLSVERIEETNIVKLRARGPRPAALAMVVNGWIDVYVEAQASAQRTSYDDVNTALDRQARDLQHRIARKRADVDRFRRKHDIVSMQREENRVLARLKGLNNSMNLAKDEEVKARSRLNAIRSAIRQGKPVVVLQDQRRIANLEKRAVELQEKIKAIELEFTPKYIALDPKLKTVYRQLTVIEENMSRLRKEAEGGVVAEAEQNLASARQGVRDLGRELTQSKRKVADFTSRFDEHEALKEELAQMDIAYREVKDRAVRRQVDREREMTKVEVIERAIQPTRPIWPHYTRDAAVSGVASLVLGILAVLFYDFFNRPVRRTAAVAAGPMVYGVAGPAADEDARAPRVASAPAPPALEHRPHRELGEAEARALVEAADEPTRLLAAALLSGIALEEAAALSRADLDPQAGGIDVAGPNARSVALPAWLRPALARLLSEGTDAEAPVWRGPDGAALAPGELDALVSCAAHDAGLADASDVSAATLRHSYISYLVRQGARLSELERVAGHLPPAVRAAYAAFSPPGPGLPLERIDLVHPALAALDEA